jgi:hypothetical protein
MSGPDHLEETIEAHHRHRPHSQFSFQDLNKATLDFHEDNELGSGGFGTVYKVSEARNFLPCLRAVFSFLDCAEFVFSNDRLHTREWRILLLE